MITIADKILDHSIISDYWKKYRTKFFQDNEVDLCNVESVDSSSISFLVKWAINCKNNNKKLVCHNCSQQLIKLIKIYRVTDLFDFK